MASNTFQAVPTAEDFERSEGVLGGPTAIAVPKDSSGDGVFAVGAMSIEAVGDEIDADLVNGQHLQCCGCCCDFRRAVIAVNSVAIGIGSLALVSALIAIGILGADAEDMEDMGDMDVDIGDEIALMEIITLIIGSIPIALYACGIYGGIYYKRWGIITAAVAHTLNMLVSVYEFVALKIPNVGFIYSGFFLYPHYFMLKQMNSGLLSPQNYHKVANCCCGDRKM